MSARRQRGVALLAMLAVVLLSISWVIVTTLNRSSSDIAAVKRTRNAEVLNRAKQTLIGYVAAQAAKAGENNPGALPCPENPGDFDSTTGRQGLVGTNCGTGSSQKVGRFPWKTLGLDQLVDADGEPLWYSISPAWGYDIGGNTVINSGTLGQLTVDGVANAAVAVIIAPGAAFAVPAATGCAARNQQRSQTGTPDWRDYLECENATNPADTTFVTTGPSGSFNDQVVTVTVAELMPAIEAAIAQRIEKEIAPALAGIYASSTWGTSASAPAFAFPAPFDDPTDADYQGSTSRTQGLLPFTYHSSSCPGGDNRCQSPQSISWTSPTVSKTGGSGWFSGGATCGVNTVSGVDTAYCWGPYSGGSMTISLTDVTNSSITTSLRELDLTNHTGVAEIWRYTGSGWVFISSPAATVSRGLKTNGGVNFFASATLPNPGSNYYYYIRAGRPANSHFADHAILSSTNATTGWFVRNKWYQYVYYAVASRHLPGNPYSCSDSGTVTCLQVTNLADPTKQRAILVLAGRALSSLSQTQPSSSLSNYLDNAENYDADTVFTQSTVTTSFNDRFITVSKNP